MSGSVSCVAEWGIIMLIVTTPTALVALPMLQTWGELCWGIVHGLQAVEKKFTFRVMSALTYEMNDEGKRVQESGFLLGYSQSRNRKRKQKRMELEQEECWFGIQPTGCRTRQVLVGFWGPARGHVQ